MDDQRPSDRADANEMRPAGVAADRTVSEPVSGMPAGGPPDLGLAAREAGRQGNPQATLDPLGMGMDAYRSNLPRSDCPFDPDSEEGQRWLEGWDHQKGVEGTHPTD